MNQPMTPIKTPRSNAILKAPQGVDNCEDLPITRVAYEDGTQAVISIWKNDSFFERLKFLFSGKVSFMSYGLTHPPISITLGDITKKLPLLSEIENENEFN